MSNINIKELLLEMIGCIFIVFCTCKSIIYLDSHKMINKPKDINTINNENLYCIFSLVYSTITSLFVFVGNSKRSYYNPILTIMGFIIQKNILFKEFFSLLLVQILGSIVGSSFVILSINSSQIEILKNNSIIGYVKRNDDFDLFACFMYEIISGILLTFILLHFSKKYEKKDEDNSNVVLFRWLCHFLISMIGFRISGGCLNPIMVIGPSLMTFDLKSSQWYYYIGPLVGIFFTLILIKELTINKIKEDIIFKKYLDNQNKIIQS